MSPAAQVLRRDVERRHVNRNDTETHSGIVDDLALVEPSMQRSRWILLTHSRSDVRNRLLFIAHFVSTAV